MLVVSKSCPFDPYKDSKENADASGVNFHARTSAEWLDPRFLRRVFNAVRLSQRSIALRGRGAMLVVVRNETLPVSP